MNNNRLKKIALLTALSSILLTGCGKKEIATTKDTEIKTEKKSTYNLDMDIVSNQTMATVIDEYKRRSGDDTAYGLFAISEYKEPKFVFKTPEGEYVYNYGLTKNPIEGYEYVDCTYNNMVIVKVNINKDNEKWYMPICGLLQTQDGEVVNVKVTTFDTEKRFHEPFEDYIYIDNPTSEKYYELVNGEEYLKATHKEPAFYVKEYKYKSN